MKLAVVSCDPATGELSLVSEYAHADRAGALAYLQQAMAGGKWTDTDLFLVDLDASAPVCVLPPSPASAPVDGVPPDEALAAAWASSSAEQHAGESEQVTEVEPVEPNFAEAVLADADAAPMPAAPVAESPVPEAVAPEAREDAEWTVPAELSGRTIDEPADVEVTASEPAMPAEAVGSAPVEGPADAAEPGGRRWPWDVAEAGLEETQPDTGPVDEDAPAEAAPDESAPDQDAQPIGFSIPAAGVLAEAVHEFSGSASAEPETHTPADEDRALADLEAAFASDTVPEPAADADGMSANDEAPSESVSDPAGVAEAEKAAEAEKTYEPEKAAEAEKAYEPDALDLRRYTCDDCVYVQTCPKHHQSAPCDCGSFQWRSV